MDRPEVMDAETCGACGGACCAIYADDPGLPLEKRMPMRVIAWYEDFIDVGALAEDGVRGTVPAGMPEPVFDPWSAHMNSSPEARDEYRASLPGVDFTVCQYCGPDGCLFPRGSRPPLCRSFDCGLLSARGHDGAASAEG